MSIIESHPLSRLPRVSRLWFGLAVTSGLLGLNLALLYRAVDAERVAVSREAESVRLGDQLSEASDLLTNEVRKFVVTADPAHMQSYWYELETRRTREVVLSRLDALGTPSGELRLLETAKNQSDGLVTTEIRGMRLMLTVMGVPEASMPVSVRNYRLLASDMKLTPMEMVSLAQSIMFDKTYSDTKRRIMEPVEAFQRALHERVARETMVARQRTNAILSALTASVAVTALLVLLVVWRRLLEVKEASLQVDQGSEAAAGLPVTRGGPSRSGRRFHLRRRMQSTVPPKATLFVALLCAAPGPARAAAEEPSADAFHRGARAEPIQRALQARAEGLAQRLTQTGPSLSSADQCFSASAAHPGLERAVLRAGCSAIMARFEGATSFSRAKFEGPVQLQSATFSGDVSFQWSIFAGSADLEHSRFEGAAEFYGALFTAPVGLFAAHFAGPARFQGARFRQRADFTTAELRGGSSFYQAEFEGAATFRGAELWRDADFSSVVFRGDVDFARARFGDSASFAQAEFNKSVSFLNARLPARLNFSDVTRLDEVIDFTKASPPSFGKKCLIDLSRSDLEKINIDYERFKLDFPEATSHQDRLAVYDGLLNNFKKRGLQMSFRTASIELERYKYQQDGRWLSSAIDDYWWDYGFAKERIFYWIFALLAGFTIINNVYFGWLLENAYVVTFLLPYVQQQPRDETCAVRFVLNLPLAFLYTSIIFFGSLFGFQREVSHFKSHRILVNIYLFTIMALGIVCTMFIVNYIVK